MNKLQQEVFILELTNRIRDELLSEIRAGNTPDEWDGYELRQWLAEVTQWETRHMSRDRKRRYHNERVARNLP